MKPKPLPSRQALIDAIAYDPETGAMLWRVRPVAAFVGKRYPAERLAKVWNSKFAGKPALDSAMSNGYLHGTFDSVYFLAHRIAWKIATGVDPDEIDHINGDRADNRIANLRSVARNMNMRNRRLSRNNTSGVIGVHKEARSGFWVAQAEIDGVNHYVGRYRDIEAAANARAAAVEGFGFTERHGQPAEDSARSNLTA